MLLPAQRSQLAQLVEASPVTECGEYHAMYQCVALSAVSARRERRLDRTSHRSEELPRFRPEPIAQLHCINVLNSQIADKSNAVALRVCRPEWPRPSPSCPRGSPGLSRRPPRRMDIRSCLRFRRTPSRSTRSGWKERAHAGNVQLRRRRTDQIVIDQQRIGACLSHVLDSITSIMIVSGRFVL